MAIKTVDQQLKPYGGGGGGRKFNIPVDGGTTLVRGVMISQLDATSMAVPTTTALAGPAIGMSTMGIDNSAGADAAERVEIWSDRAFEMTNETGADALSEAFPLYMPVYATDDTTVANNSAGDTRPLAGYFFGMEPDGAVRVFVPSQPLSSLIEAGLFSGASEHGVRGRSTANIANLAAFTVAGVDGLTYVQNERILLMNQAAPATNGIFVVGVVAGGLAPLTRAIDADGADEIVPGMKVNVSEGTLYNDLSYQLTTNAPIVIDTTALVFAEISYEYGVVGAMVAEAIGVAANAGVALTGSRIDHVHAMPAAATPVGTGEAAADGVATTLVLSDHVHNEYSKEVRYVMTTDVPNLAAFVITQDGIVGVQGDLVLLANQTVPAESGIYELGAVAGTAPLVRAAHLPVGAIVTGGYTCHVNEGTLFANTSWFIAEAGQITIDTTAHTWYPETATFSLGIPAGTGTITWADIPILSATKTQFMFTNAVEVTADLTVRYGLDGAATAGVVGTCTATMIAEIAAGTVNVDDDSTMIISVINR